MEMEPIYYAVLVGIAVYVLVIAIVPRRFLADQSHTRTQLERLASESARLSPSQRSAMFRDEVYATGPLGKLFMKMPGSEALYAKLLRAGLHNSIDKFLVGCFMSCLVLLFVLRGGGVWGIMAALALTWLGARFYIGRRISKRNQAFVAGFPDALDMIVRSVRSGYPLTAAVRMVAENMQPPISTEFRQVADETSYGSSLIEALQRLSQRIDEPDIRFFVVVLTVQQEVGGNLAEVLSNLSALIRKRKHLYMKIKALSSEGRATAWVLGLLPVFEFLAIYLVAPTHLTPLFVTTLGNIILLGAVAIVLLGVFIVKQMINIEV